jgi:hypothetical protein
MRVFEITASREMICMIMVLLLAAGDGVAWQSPSGDAPGRGRADWEKVRGIAPGSEIEVEVRSPVPSAPRRSLRGRLAKWEPGALVIDTRKEGGRQIPRPDVLAVLMKERGSRRKVAAMGGAIGFGLGMAIGAKAAGELDTHGGTGQKIGIGALFGAVFGGIFALVGAAAGGTKMTLVYQAPK